MSVVHDTLRASREYDHDVRAVWAAWADGEVKRQWFDLSDDPAAEWRSDFRVGGTETFRSAPGASPAVVYAARFCDIVEPERIVSTTQIVVDDLVTSVSVSTAELAPFGRGTRVSVTEQVAFLDGRETVADRSGGATSQLERLAAWLDRDRARP